MSEVDFDYAGRGLRAPQRRPEIPDGPKTVAEVLAPLASADPDREALVGRHGRFRYGELDLAVESAALGLHSLGVTSGDRVAACLPNDVDIVIAFLAAMRLGAIWVGINRALATPEKTYLLNDSGAMLLLAPSEVIEPIERARRDLPELGTLVRCDPGGDDRDHRDEWESIRAAASGGQRPAVEIDAHAPAAIAYTSGTTGFPKGAVHSQHNLLLPGAVSRATGRYDPGLRQGCVLPLTILNLMVLSPLVAFQIGSCCVAMDRIDPLGLAEWVRGERVGTFAGVPTIFHDLLTHPDVAPSDLSSLVAPQVGGAECPEEFRRLYRDRFGREVGIGYGMTEAPTAVTQSASGGTDRPGLCGVALPQVSIEIRDENEQILAPEEVGEICVAPARRGSWVGIYTPMLGYWRCPEATERALRGDAYHTGDLGFLDDEGTLFIRGRRNELILRGGANVYPAEVERAIQEDPRVAAAAVLGIPDPRLGQRVVAAVQPEAGERLTAEQIASFCRERLARYKIPEQIAIVSGLPRNSMSKVIKRELEPLFRERAP